MHNVKYKKAPLPFVGQKRNFVKALIPIIERQPDDTIFVDLFGGSGLLSNLVKELKPNARVIYNDFDNYAERLAHIGETEELRQLIAGKLKDTPKSAKLSEDLKADICDMVEDFEKRKGFVDLITVGTWVLFSSRSMASVKPIRERGDAFYNRLPSSPYTAEGYLQGVERVNKDFKELIEEFKDNPKTLFICDPPYMLTDKAHYKQSHWGVGDYLDLLKDMAKLNSIYFTSSKSGLLDIYKWWEEDLPELIGKPYTVASSHTCVGKGAKAFEDIMMYNV